MINIPYFSFRRLFQVVFLRLQKIDIWPGSFRYHLLRLGGVKISSNTHVGGGNLFDSLRPDLILIEEGTTISVGCVIVSHFVKQRLGYREWSFGEVKIGKNCYLGANVVICQPVTIGDNSAVAAGAVVTKDIPPGEIWGGVPAKFLKKVE